VTWVWKISIGLLLGLLAAAVGGTWFMAGFTVTSAAMEPAAPERSIVLVSRLSLSTREPGRQDVVVLQLPDQEGQVVRRIVGLPGEVVEIRDDDVYIGGVKLDEPYRQASPEAAVPAQSSRPAGAPPASVGAATVPAGAYFVLGDNRKGPGDSRTFGYVPRDHVLGVVWTLMKKPVAL